MFREFFHLGSNNFEILWEKNHQLFNTKKIENGKKKRNHVFIFKTLL